MKKKKVDGAKREKNGGIINQPAYTKFMKMNGNRKRQGKWK